MMLTCIAIGIGGMFPNVSDRCSSCRVNRAPGILRWRHEMETFFLITGPFVRVIRRSNPLTKASDAEL